MLYISTVYIYCLYHSINIHAFQFLRTFVDHNVFSFHSCESHSSPLYYEHAIQNLLSSFSLKYYFLAFSVLSSLTPHTLLIFLYSLFACSLHFTLLVLQTSSDTQPLLFCCCLPTPMTLASGWSPMFPLVVHQPSSPSIWPAVQSLRRGLSTNPGATMWAGQGCDE